MSTITPVSMPGGLPRAVPAHARSGSAPNVTVDIDTALEWRGRTVVDRHGEKIGRFGDVYLDSETDLPAYAAVSTGLFGTKETYVRLDDARPEGDDIQVAYDREHVLEAPRLDQIGRAS